jgi:hypothetical protein
MRSHLIGICKFFNYLYAVTSRTVDGVVKVGSQKLLNSISIRSTSVVSVHLRVYCGRIRIITDAYDVVICLQLVMPPSLSFRAMLLGVATIHFFLCNLTEVGYIYAMMNVNAARFASVNLHAGRVLPFFESEDRTATGFYILSRSRNL